MTNVTVDVRCNNEYHAMEMKFVRRTFHETHPDTNYLSFPGKNFGVETPKAVSIKYCR